MHKQLQLLNTRIPQGLETLEVPADPPIQQSTTPAPPPLGAEESTRIY